MNKELYQKYRSIVAARDEDATDPFDPANARYTAPLDDPKLEAEAIDMAGASFEVPAGASEEYAEAVYQQRLIDARRMLLDKDYGRQFGMEYEGD
jgi:hypothetical protein